MDDTAFVFRRYSKSALDAEYDNRSKTPDVEVWKKAQADGSDEARRRFDCRQDVKYGPSGDERLDIYRASGPGPHPVHIFFHGGYWRSNHKEEFGFLALPFVPFGVTVVVVEYALVPSVTLAELVRQCRAAVAWVWRNAPAFGGDPGRIAVSGHSAGGHLTATMMATDWPAFAPDLPAEPIVGGCAISGIYDLEPIRHCSQNDLLGFGRDEVARFSPVTMRPTCLGPLLLPVGGTEGPEFIRQAEDMAASRTANGAEGHAWVMPGHHHFSTINEFLKPESELSRAARAQLGIV